MDYSIAPRAGLRRYVTTSGSDTSGLNQQNQNSMAAWAAIIPAAASLVGSAINTLTGKANRDLQRETNQQNFQNMVYQNNWNREQWNLENEYNSPAAQSQRLREAGINPNMVFGNGSVSEAGSLQSAPVNAAVAPQMPYVGADIANGVYTGINAYNQAQLINAQTDEIRERTSGQSIQNQLDRMMLYAKVDALDIDNKYKSKLFDLLDKTFDFEVAYKKGQVRNQDENTNYIIQQTTYLKARQKMEEDKNKSDIALNDAQIDYLAEWLSLHREEVDIAWENAKTYSGEVQYRKGKFGEELVHMLNQDELALKQVGISEDLSTSQKFKNYFGGIAETAIGFGLGSISKASKPFGMVVRGFRQ